MYNKILNFVKYNNAFTILFVLFIFGSGMTFAATNPEIISGVYTSEETITSVNNTLITSIDLDSFNFNLKIKDITDDEKKYYVVYSYQTLAILDGVWQNNNVEKTLTIDKNALLGKDLGLYLARELGENINYELAYLKKVQKLEQEKGESQKTITTEYSGLIGKLLDPKEEVIEGYTPVIVPEVPEVPVTVEENPEDVIVSTQYPEQVIVPEQSPKPTPAPTPIHEQTPEPMITPTPEPEPEQVPEPVIQPVLEPEPEQVPVQIIDEELVQEVVEALLENDVSEDVEVPASTEQQVIVEQQAEQEDVAETPAQESPL